MKDDLISRLAAIDAVMITPQKWDGMYIQDLNCRLRDTLNALPSAQPEIIRCKDCKDYQTDWETRYPNMHYCATMDSAMPEDGFCSYAERRETE